MYDFKVHWKIENVIADQLSEKSIENNLFSFRSIANASYIRSLHYGHLWRSRSKFFVYLILAASLPIIH